MSYCDHCGQGIAAVPYKCKHCGKTLCPDHRLAEFHACEAMPRVRTRP